MEYWQYELKTRGFLNAHARGEERSGALLKIEGGYACLQPWPELGDEPLDIQLHRLAAGEETPLIRQALYFAGQDRRARAEGVSLFEGLEVPKSHCLVMGWVEGAHRVSEWAQHSLDQGFTRWKLKWMRGDEAELRAFRRLLEGLRGTPLQLRLDLNGLWKSSEQVSAWVEALAGEEFFERVEFVEDPTPFDPQLWESLAAKYPLRWALDRCVLPCEALTGQGFEVQVIKPALQDAALWAEWAAGNMKRIVVTSYMDHPVGQSFAAWEAARLFQKHPLLMEEAGLLTHGIYEPTVFSERLKVQSARFVPDSGPGIGFGEVLESLSWKTL